MQSLLLWVFAFVSGKNVESFFEVDANGPFKKTGRELRRIKEDDSGERLGFLSKVEGAEGSRTLNGSDLFSIPRQLGVHSSSRRNADEGRGNTESSQPPEGTQQREPAAIRSDIPRASVPEETEVPEEDNFDEGSRLLNDSDLGVSIARQSGAQTAAIPSNIFCVFPCNIFRVFPCHPLQQFVPEEKTEVPGADNCAIPCNIPHGSDPEDSCAICLQPKKNEELCAPFECATVKHDYHKTCTEELIGSGANPTCPSCRAGLPSDSPLNALRPTEEQQQTAATLAARLLAFINPNLLMDAEALTAAERLLERREEEMDLEAAEEALEALRRVVRRAEMEEEAERMRARMEETTTAAIARMEAREEEAAETRRGSYRD